MQMDDRTHLARSLLDIQTLETPEELADALNVISARYGLSHVTFLALRTGSTSPLTPFYASTYPQEWINTYVVNDYIAIDPVVAIARTGLLPIGGDNPRSSNANSVSEPAFRSLTRQM